MSNQSTLPPGLLDLLLEEGLLSTSAAARIRSTVQEGWVPIGRILRQRGHLTIAQMMHLLEMQTSEPHLRLGELAVREGFCKEKDIEEALRLQQEASPHPLGVYLAEVQGDREQLCRVLLRYIRQLEARIAEQPILV